MPRTRNIASAYVTRANRLLVFRQPDSPEVGVMVPGGTVEADESPEEAVLREVREETGLTRLRLGAFLGEYEHYVPGLAETHHVHCYHVLCDEDAPETWRHDETDPAIGPQRPITFEFFWADLPDGVPPLHGDQGRAVPRLVQVMQRPRR
jgi:8-oxo-dGTP pyrophosphatase MutT (NUDIX family)